MDTTKIIQLKLTKESLVPFEILEDYNIVLINKENYNNYIHELLYVSDLMKRDFDWVGIPDELMLHSRFETHNSSVHLFYYNNSPIGWMWGNHNQKPLCEEMYQPLKSNEMFVGGAFVTQKLKNKPKGCGVSMYHLTLKKFLEYDGIDCLYSHADTWNVKSIHICYKVVWYDFNFIKENNGNTEH